MRSRELVLPAAALAFAISGCAPDSNSSEWFEQLATLAPTSEAAFREELIEDELDELARDNLVEDLVEAKAHPEAHVRQAVGIIADWMIVGAMPNARDMEFREYDGAQEFGECFFQRKGEFVVFTIAPNKANFILDRGHVDRLLPEETVAYLYQCGFEKWFAEANAQIIVQSKPGSLFTSQLMREDLQRTAEANGWYLAAKDVLNYLERDRLSQNLQIMLDLFLEHEGDAVGFRQDYLELNP